MNRSHRILLSVLFMTVLAQLAHRGSGSEALSPEASLETIRARPGLRVELVAAEPLVESPVAFDWGPDGRLWVVEMRDYPLGMDNRGTPGSRVVCLDDRNGDGRFDTSTVFLDGLLFATSVMTWGRGVLIACAPDLLYAEDTDGDGRADRREVLITGFGEANPQHRVNGLRWGLDNWVYGANGDFAPARPRNTVGPSSASTNGFSPSQAEDLRRLSLAGSGVKSVKTGTLHDLRNRDFRFRPDDGRLDPQSGQSQFGRDRDDWGDWFGCNHATPMWHYALDDHYLRRNPHVASPGSRVEAPRSPTFAIGNGRDTGTRRSGQGNPWTSACSVTVYRDTLLGPEFANNWITCEPVHNLIHREVLRPVGTTFTSHRAADEATTELLASSDPMFTPVAIRTGPDGALWVADMYRKVLEHPHWLPPGWEQRVDVREGHDKGRIYRISPIDRAPRRWPRLDRLDTAGLVAQLDSPNGWLRDKAQQILVQRQDSAAVEMLDAKALRGESPLGRLHALCTLDGLHALKSETLRRALADADPGVRRHAVRLSEHEKLRSPRLEAALLERVTDSDPFVRLQLAYALGSCTSAESAQALGTLLRQDGGDPRISAAALSSLTLGNIRAVVETVLANPREAAPPVMLGMLQSASGWREPKAISLLLAHLAIPRSGPPGRHEFAVLAGWLDSLDQRNTPLPRLAEQLDAAHRSADLRPLASLFDAARRAARDPKIDVSERVQAVSILGRGLEAAPEDRDLLKGLIAPRNPEELQAAALTALGHLRDSDVAEALLVGWKGLTPRLRAQVLENLLGRSEGPDTVLKALEDSRMLPQDVPLTIRQRLVEHVLKAVRERAGKLFHDPVDPDRNKVIVAYQSALNLKGDPARGLQRFTKTCASCHRIGTVGQAVGPDLSMVREKPPEWFLPALFDPSRAVDARYLNYLATTQDGRTFAGVLAEEGGSSITLVNAAGERQVILRVNLEELASTGKSAMPEGLEKELQPQDVADVIAYLRNPVQSTNGQ